MALSPNYGQLPTVITGGGGTANSDPYSQPQTWDSLVLGGNIMPGIVFDYDGFDYESGWQEKKGKGSIGSTLTFVQKPPAHGHFIMELASQSDFRTMGPIRQALLANPAVPADQQAMSMTFPPTDDLGINSVIIKSISPVKSIRTGAGRRYRYKIELFQFLPTPATSVVATATYTSAGTPGTLPPNYVQVTAPQTAAQITSQLFQQLQSSP